MRVFFLLVALCLFPFWGQGQSQTLSLRGGLSSVRGETTKHLEIKQMGLHGGLLYAQALYYDDEQWQWLVKYNGNFDRIDYVYHDSLSPYQASIHSSALLVGLRYYPCRGINRYKPYFGQLLPYLSAYPGLLLASNQLHSKRDYRLPFRTLELDLAFAFELEAGLQIVLSERWRTGWYLSSLWSSSDYLDGVRGNTDLKDVLIETGLELTYRL